MVTKFKKSIKWTIIQTVIFNPMNNQFIEHKRFETPEQLTNDEAKEFITQQCEPYVLVGNVRHETRYHEITINDFINNSIEITEKQFKYNYKKKK